MIKTVRRKDIDALVLGPNGVPSQIGCPDFYAPKSGQPDQWLDAVWLDPRVGNVEVGPVASARQGRVGVEGPDPARHAWAGWARGGERRVACERHRICDATRVLG
ncbi:hypothetical protein [Pseudoxanthomonas suwonensis]|uniref:hypothetical protein n=1 Tax=Pseudoxanthomonas suwonensis TaxID=314722 RepID=UPI00138F5145|nr:hypothetical protein [Pseudoxanthomonas suwonensis]KAF1698618.1 hypothetical protein CSC68_15510 [Pseudoxanthomonas suwonensis]